MTSETKRLPRGIHQLPDGRFRVYATRQGKALRLTVSWELLKELKVPVTPTRLQHPGLELTKAALVKLQSKILEENRTGTIEGSVGAKVRVGDLFSLIEDDYAAEKLKSWDDVQSRWNNHLKSHFGHLLVNGLGSDDVKSYVLLRQREGAANASINRELSIIKRMLSLGMESDPPKVEKITKIKKLKESEARQGFLSDKTYDTLAQECSREGLWLRGLFAVGVSFGWRRGEVINLKVSQVDFQAGTIRLDPGSTKNDEGRIVRMTNEVRGILSVCATGKQPTDFLFARDAGRHSGKHVGDFRVSWKNACERAGCSGLLFHDLRRTGARNLRRLGVSEGVVMKIGGWRTRDVFERYNIVDEADLADAARRLDAKRAAVATDTKTDTSAMVPKPVSQQVQ